MISTEASESIARPAEDVFAFVADVRNDPKWHLDVLEAKLVEGATVEKGSVFEIKIKPAMGETGGTVTVTEFDPPGRVVFDVRMGKLQPTTTFTVTPQAGGSTITRHIDMEPTGMMKLMAPFMKGMMSKRNVGFLGNLKRVLETQR